MLITKQICVTNEEQKLQLHLQTGIAHSVQCAMCIEEIPTARNQVRSETAEKRGKCDLRSQTKCSNIIRWLEKL